MDPIDPRTSTAQSVPAGRPTSGGRRRQRSRGQVLALFALSIFVLTGFVAIVIDVSWYWASSLRVQRAADAAAMAGVVYLPGNPGQGVTNAVAEAEKNGVVDASLGGTATVTAAQDPGNQRQMDVTISAPVPTFFMRVFGIQSITATRKAKAQYILPVPMGSPENFYGVYCLTTNTQSANSDGSCPSGISVPDASGSGTLPSKGFWGAFQSSGDPHNEGDAFMPLSDPLHPGSNKYGGTNPDYDPNGYNYAVEVPANGGNIYIFDPTFCAVKGGIGSGDHFNGGTQYSVTSYYRLYNTKNTPYDLTDDTKLYDSGTLFESEFAQDQSAAYGNAGIGATSADGVSRQDCQQTPQGQAPYPGNTDPTKGRYWHDRWWKINPNPLPAGVYRINIQSAPMGAANFNAHAENDFSIEVTGSPDGTGNKPRVYGLGRMVGYNIIQSSSGFQKMYLAQIGPENAGKTVEIDLFDPGDVGGNAYLRILSPDGNAYNYATFSYTTDTNCINGSSDSCSGAGRTVVQTANGGSSSFNDTWIKILIPLPSTYGLSGLTPPGEPAAGWWKIEYQVGSGNDTTTWMVNIQGNPVHLVVP